MNAKHIESKFAAMGARLKIREMPTRRVAVPIRLNRATNAPDYAIDIRRDDHGEFFELRVPDILHQNRRA